MSKKTKLPIRFLRLNDQGYHLALHVKINGKKAHILIDSGASNTVFDKTRLELFVKDPRFVPENKLSTGLGTNSMESESIQIKKLELGTLIIADYLAVVLDLGHVNKSYESMGFKSIEGVLGSDILKKHKAVIDYGKKLLVLELPVKKKKK
jgi:predicted aspartyl protease